MTYRICFVCTGNICRSPVAEVVMRRLLEEAGLADQVRVDSAGTGAWHVGDGADPRALTSLRSGGYDGSTHRARVFERSWLAERDLVVALDSGHARALRALAADAGEREKVQLLRSFGGAGTDGDLEVADPYFGSRAAFDAVLTQVEDACRGLLDWLLREGVTAPGRAR